MNATPDTKVLYEYAEDALELAHLANALHEDPDSADEAKRFGTLLAKTLARENGADQKVLRAAVKLMRMHHSEDAATWLINELEIETSLQYLPAPGHTKPKACLLFAIPVVFAAFQSPGKSLLQNRNFESLHTVIQETQVVAASHGFRLLPTLFTYEELSQLPHHEVLKLTLKLAHQVLDAPTEPLRVEPLENLELPLASSVHADDYPHVQLRYLIGMAVTNRSALNELMPTLDSDYDPQAADFQLPPEIAGSSSGRFENGTWWTLPFAKLIEASSVSVAPLLEIGNPDGFHDALRLGTERMRAQDMRLRIDHAAKAAGFEATAALVDVSPMSDGFGHMNGLLVDVFVPGIKEAIDSFIWYQLPHEEPVEMQLELTMLLEGMALKQTSTLPGNPGMQLH
jgi:hypothetical protein